MLSTLSILAWGIGGVVVFTLVLGWWMNGYFRRRGVKSPPAYLPFVGHMFSTLTRQQHFRDIVHDSFKEFENEKYFGLMLFSKPVVVPRDAEILKQICIKDFDHFVDRTISSNDNADLLFGRSVFSLEGQKWKDMRATLSPAFTSSRMKAMFEFIVECCDQTIDYFKEEMQQELNRSRGLLELEMKDTFTRFTNDVIASTAFGLKVNSFLERENQFFMIGKEATDFTKASVLIRFLFVMIFSKTAKLLGMNYFLPKRISNFFRSLVWNTMKDREDRKILRNDMIHLLMEARKGTLKYDSSEDHKETGFAILQDDNNIKGPPKREWEDDDIVAQAVQFFAAGFDTSSILACFLAHLLAVHPEIQQKLQREIDLTAEIEGKLKYDTLHKMKYLDMVVSETLRLWPSTIGVDRKCIKPYTLPHPNETSSEGLKLNVGDGVFLAIYALHHNPKYFKDPERFDPERFSDENKSDIVPGSYIPFGLGPRSCIASRFALMEVKAVIYSILLDFDIVTTAKTQHPIKMNKLSMTLSAEKGFWVGLRPRHSHG